MIPGNHHVWITKPETTIRTDPEASAPGASSSVLARLRSYRQAALLRVLDDRVDAAHGVTRADDPQRYAAIVGPELARFSESAESDPAALTRRSLVELVDRIEQL